MSRTRTNVLTTSDVDSIFSVKISNDIIALRVIDAESINTELDTIIAKHIAVTGAISTELITSFINYYNFCHENH